MAQLQATPLIYEIHTWVWLDSLSRKYGRPIDLSCVPSAEWDAICDFGFNTVWLMGVWARSPTGRTIAQSIPALLDEYRKALPDFTLDDVAGSPYCILDYSVDQHLGGREGLASARQELATRGLQVILDFVPNHVAPDHRWLDNHPEFFIGASADEASRNPGLYFKQGDRYFAHGRDPYFPPWTDTAQLNAFDAGLRTAAAQTVLDIASQCDGVRCDMAMLLLTDIFQRTWGQLAGPAPATEYWADLIGIVRAQQPAFLFLAEAYWDLEYALQQLGFDYCYDKRLYDRLCHENADSVRAHLGADISYQRKLVRFLENHDEPRAAAVLDDKKLRAAATAVATLPGAQLYYDGQLTGRRVKLPVQLGRRPDEPDNSDLEEFYRSTLRTARQVPAANGQWQLSGQENQGNVLAWDWTAPEATSRVTINFGDTAGSVQSNGPTRELAAWEYQVIEAPVTGNRSR